MTELEIWTCKHDVKEFFLGWQTMKKDEWAAQHQHQDDWNPEDPCEPDIKRIDVEDIEEEFVGSEESFISTDSTVYVYRCSHGIEIVMPPVIHESDDALLSFAESHEGEVPEEEYERIMDQFEEGNEPCDIDIAELDLSTLDEGWAQKLEFHK